MPEINIIPSASIPRIPDVVIPNQTTLPTTTHVTRMLPPTFDMPCATVRTDGTKNSQLFTDDPAGNVVINCPIPFYEPLQYNAKDLVPIQEAEPPTNVEQPPIAETETPEVPKIPEDDKVECPDPKKNNPRIGDLNAKGTEKVVGFKYIEETTECVVQYEPTTVVEKYLPSINQTTTTVAIAVVATAGAAATPLLLRVFKPVITKLWKTLQKKLGKKVDIPSRAEIRANKYREKKGLPPLKRKN